MGVVALVVVVVVVGIDKGMCNWARLGIRQRTAEAGRWDASRRHGEGSSTCRLSNRGNCRPDLGGNGDGTYWIVATGFVPVFLVSLFLYFSWLLVQ